MVRARVLEGMRAMESETFSPNQNGTRFITGGAVSASDAAQRGVARLAGTSRDWARTCAVDAPRRKSARRALTACKSAAFLRRLYWSTPPTASHTCLSIGTDMSCSTASAGRQCGPAWTAACAASSLRRSGIRCSRSMHAPPRWHLESLHRQYCFNVCTLLLRSNLCWAPDTQTQRLSSRTGASRCGRIANRYCRAFEEQPDRRKTRHLCRRRRRRNVRPTPSRTSADRTDGPTQRGNNEATPPGAPMLRRP